MLLTGKILDKLVHTYKEDMFETAQRSIACTS